MNAYIALPGSRRNLLPHSRSAGPVDLSTPASLTVHVRSVGDLEALKKEVYSESLKPLKDRTYLSREDYDRQYGASVEDLNLVEKFAQKHNLFVAGRHAGSRSIVLKGKLGNLLDAFPTDLHMYHHSSGTYRGRRGEIHIPKELDGVLTGVFGFDTRPKHRAPHLHKSMAQREDPQIEGMTPVDFAKRYGFPEKFNGVKLDGSGQTIAIIELGGGYRSSDLNAYFQKVGVSAPSVVSVAIDNAGNDPSTQDSADGEVMMDIEIAGAVAPNARIVVYFAPGQGDQGFLDAISAAIFDKERKPGVISISWGIPEDDLDDQALDSYHELFLAAARIGITVCVATGDHGVACLSADQWDGKIHVSHPSSDDLVLACGGTQIDERDREVVWNDGTPFDKMVRGGDGWASTGGISPYFRVPLYQQGLKLPQSLAVASDWTGPEDKSGRGLPDIAMSATNYFTRVDGLETTAGGTSAVAPLMSALVALLNQAKQKNVGFLNPFLYANADKDIFQDVAEGNNGIAGTVEGYSSKTGWDACTGLGVPRGTSILNRL
jgi:kumamolisin